MFSCPWMELNEATVRGQPQIALLIIENPPKCCIWETVFLGENREGSQAPIKRLKACEGADPQRSLAILAYGAHAIVGRRLEKPRVVAINGELICLGVKP